MTKETFFDLKEELRIEYSKKEKQLDILYATSNASAKVGEPFTDHIGTIVVEEIIPIGTYSSRGLPSCAYKGVRCKKNGHQNKSGEKRIAYECNNIKNK
jgi:hypothetical protein